MPAISSSSRAAWAARQVHRRPPSRHRASHHPRRHRGERQGPQPYRRRRPAPTGTAAGSSPMPPPPPAAVPDVPVQLERLEGMLQRGTISKAEFDAQKAKLLGLSCAWSASSRRSPRPCWPGASNPSGSRGSASSPGCGSGWHEGPGHRCHRGAGARPRGGGRRGEPAGGCRRAGPAGLAVHVTHVRSVGDVGPCSTTLRPPSAGRRPASLPVPRPHADVRHPMEANAWSGRRGRLAFVPIWRRPWMTMYADTYGSSVLAALGVVNVFGDEAKRYPTTTLDDAAARQPDLVLPAGRALPVPGAPPRTSSDGRARRATRRRAGPVLVGRPDAGGAGAPRSGPRLVGAEADEPTGPVASDRRTPSTAARSSGP